MKKLTLILTLLLAVFATTNVVADNRPLAGDGSCLNPYLISSIDDWNTFTSLLNDPATAPLYADKYYKLTADIGTPQNRVTTIAAENSSYPFRGTFNGNGHSIFLGLVREAANSGRSDKDKGVALFHFVSDGCVIHDLWVTGTILTDSKFAAGIISVIESGNSSNWNNVALSRCRSTVTIYSSVNGDATSAGLVGLSDDYDRLNITDCLFDGTFQSPNGTCFSGMVGWQDPWGHTYFESCYVAPAYLFITGQDCYTYCRYNEDFNYSEPCLELSNCYYTVSINKSQGKYMSSSTSASSAASKLGFWKVMEGKPVPMTIDDWGTDCTLFSGYSAYNYHIPYNTNNNETGSEGYKKLVDANRGSKWCICYPTSTSDQWSTVYVDFSFDMHFLPLGYILTTGNDTEDHPDRRPKTWNIYGYDDENHRWVMLDSRDAGSHSDYALPEVNVADKAYVMHNQFIEFGMTFNSFRLEITSIFRPETIHHNLHPWYPNPNDFVMELGEIRFFGTVEMQDVHKLEYCALSGMQSTYEYDNGNVIPLDYVVSNHYGTVLTKDVDYTETILRSMATTDTVTEVKEAAEYTLILNGKGLYRGNKTYTFVVSNDSLPSPMYLDSYYNYCVNLPSSGQSDLNLAKTESTAAFIQPFHVYDDGGAYHAFSSDCDGGLLITAPEGYFIQISGGLDVSPYDFLRIYDGNSVDSPLIGEYSEGDIVEMRTTTGRDMLIWLQTRYYGYNSPGIDLMAVPVCATKGHVVSVDDTENGTVTAPTDSIMVNTQVTLNIAPSDGYMLQSLNTITIGSSVPVEDGLWYMNNTATATFTMPGNDVTVTPDFKAKNALSVNMPYNVNDPGQALQVNIPDDVTTFKVYDAGGPDGSYGSYTASYLLLIAPPDKMLQISGTIDFSDEGTYFTAYDGNTIDQLLCYHDNQNPVVGAQVSSGNEMLLHYDASYDNGGNGVDLTVKVVDPMEPHTITMNQLTGGTIKIDDSTAPATAYVFDTVTMSVAHDDGYLVNALDVVQTVDGVAYSVDVSNGLWHDTITNEAKFVMPAGDATVTPTFISEFTAEGGLSVNMPESNYVFNPKIVNIPIEVTSFKVYDDGGADGNYSSNCNSYMVLTAPIGYRIKLSGTVTEKYGALKVYDSDTTANPLGNADGYGSENGENMDELCSSGRSMMLHFYAGSVALSGLDLKAELTNERPYTITFDNSNIPAGCDIAIEGYQSVSGNHYVAHVNDTITVNVTCDSTHLLQSLGLRDAHGNEISMKRGVAWYNGNNLTTTFSMPARQLTITPEFVEKGYQYVNMPKKRTSTNPLVVTMPEGITAFKIYDDGGANANYSDNCNGYMLLTAPEGKVWQLTGTVMAETHFDFLEVFEGNDEQNQIGLNYADTINGGENIGGLVTFGNQMLVRFYSNYSYNYAGLDLTATVIDPVTRIVKGYGSNTEYGAWNFISTPAKDYLFPEEVPNLIPTVNGEPDPTSTNYDLYRYNQSADLEWENYKSHLSSFTLDRGCGYLYANRYQQILQFGGEVNVEDSMELPLDYDANAGVPGVNLVGNPLLTDAYVDRPYYMMSDDGRDIEPVDMYTRWPIEMGTGIIVCADDENDAVTFSKTAPTSKTMGEGGLLLTLTKTDTQGEEEHDKAIVSFREGLKLRKFIFNKERAKVFIPKDDKDYAIIYSEKTGELPLSFKAVNDGEYTIAVRPVIAEMEYLHLIDNLTGSNVDLLTTPVYSFTSNAGEFTSRFRLVFSAYSIPENEGSNNASFAFVSNGEIIFTCNVEHATLQIVDLLGRVVDSRTGDGINRVSTSGMVPGIYVLRLIDGNVVRTQKIVIE